MVATADHIRIHLQACQQREMPEQLLDPRHFLASHREPRANGLREDAPTLINTVRGVGFILREQTN